MRNVEKKKGAELMEFGSGTLRRPMGRDYAAAKDAASGHRVYAPEGMRNVEQEEW